MSLNRDWAPTETSPVVTSELSRNGIWAERYPWLTAILLFVPMGMVFASHLWLAPSNLWPTGFVHYEHIGYYAMEREHFDGGGFSLLFSLPFSPEYDSPHIYFQPHTLLIGTVVELTGWDPGRTYLAVGVIAGVIMLRLLGALYFRAVRSRGVLTTLGLVVCAWGGGLFLLAGIIRSLLHADFSAESLFAFDARYDLWFLSVGRNLYFTNEAYYHCLAFGLLIALWDRQFSTAAVLLALLSASTPFTGLQFLCVTLAWAVGEYLCRRPVPLWFAAGCAVLLALHCGYYLYLLPRLSPDHEALLALWERDLSFDLSGLLLAYGLLVPFALLAVARGALRSSQGRLLGVMAAVSLALATHQLLLPARQPLHFTRGYIWLPLFLLAIQNTAWYVSGRASRRLLLASFAGLLLLDNTAWIALQVRNNTIGASHAKYLTPARREVMERLASADFRGYLLVSDVELLSYEAMAYTPLRSWYSHLASTPHAAQRLAEIEIWSKTGLEPLEWIERPVVFVVEDRGQDLSRLPWVTTSARIERVHIENEAYWVIRRPISQRS